MLPRFSAVFLAFGGLVAAQNPGTLNTNIEYKTIPGIATHGCQAYLPTCTAEYQSCVNFLEQEIRTSINYQCGNVTEYYIACLNDSLYGGSADVCEAQIGTFTTTFSNCILNGYSDTLCRNEFPNPSIDCYGDTIEAYDYDCGQQKNFYSTTANPVSFVQCGLSTLMRCGIDTGDGCYATAYCSGPGVGAPSICPVPAYTSAPSNSFRLCSTSSTSKTSSKTSSRTTTTSKSSSQSSSKSATTSQSSSKSSSRLSSSTSKTSSKPANTSESSSQSSSKAATTTTHSSLKSSAAKASSSVSSSHATSSNNGQPPPPSQSSTTSHSQSPPPPRSSTSHGPPPPLHRSSTSTSEGHNNRPSRITAPSSSPFQSFSAPNLASNSTEHTIHSAQPSPPYESSSNHAPSHRHMHTVAISSISPPPPTSETYIPETTTPIITENGPTPSSTRSQPHILYFCLHLTYTNEPWYITSAGQLCTTIEDAAILYISSERLYSAGGGYVSANPHVDPFSVVLAETYDDYEYSTSFSFQPVGTGSGGPGYGPGPGYGLHANSTVFTNGTSEKVVVTPRSDDDEAEGEGSSVGDSMLNLGIQAAGSYVLQWSNSAFGEPNKVARFCVSGGYVYAVLVNAPLPVSCVSVVLNIFPIEYNGGPPPPPLSSQSGGYGNPIGGLPSPPLSSSGYGDPTGFPPPPPTNTGYGNPTGGPSPPPNQTPPHHPRSTIPTGGLIPTSPGGPPSGGNQGPGFPHGGPPPPPPRQGGQPPGGGQGPPSGPPPGEAGQSPGGNQGPGFPPAPPPLTFCPPGQGLHAYTTIVTREL